MSNQESRLSKFPLLRLLLGSMWFRILLALAVGLPLLLGLAVAKIWTTSPKGFTPKVKSSVVHLVQSWSLKRSAIKAASKGQTDHAIYCWRMAVAHNPAKADLSRQLLSCILTASNKQDHAGLALQQSFWLVRLTETNLADVELVSRVFQAYQMDALTVALLRPLATNLSPQLTSVLLKALFRTGQADEFGRIWDKSAPRQIADPELALYRSAYDAGWGKDKAMKSGWQKLDQALQQPPHQVLASQLTMMSAFKAQNAASYEKAFIVSTNLHADRIVDHVNRWRLYAGLTNLARATQLARAFSRYPSNSLETLSLAQTYVALGLRDKAQRTLKEALPAFGHTPELWLFCADVLSREKQWDELMALANQMRQDRRVSRDLTGQSYFLEGLAEAARQHRAQAETAFKKGCNYDLPAPQSAIGIAAAVLQLGFADCAKLLLLKHEGAFKQEPGYWFLLYNTAIGAKDENLLLDAAKQLYTLAPTNWEAQYSYAAALVTLRVQPQDALKMTEKLLKERPDNLGVRVNHSLALLQNQRIPEAHALLQGIDGTKLSPLEASALCEARFEVCFAQQDFAQARQLGTQVNRNFLFPSELRWFDNALRQITGKK